MNYIQKWDFKKKEYVPYKFPENWKISCYEDEMNNVINCAGCGKEITYGDGYTSRTIHTKMGFGYSVCSDCYNREWKEERQANK
jgi:hypothetical protein